MNRTSLGVFAVQTPQPVIHRLRLFLSSSLIAAAICFHSGAAEREVKPIPAPGLPIPDADRAALSADLNRLADEIAALRNDLKAKPGLLRLLSDVQIFDKAVRYALSHNEFY